jgi:hypothetical protein
LILAARSKAVLAAGHGHRRLDETDDTREGDNDHDGQCDDA